MLPADSPFAPLSAPGPHPATAELRAYAAGTLAAAEEHRIEAHTLDCERCAELVDGFSMSDAATTDQAVAALRSRLQARVGVPEAGTTGRMWPRLAAAAALLGVVAGGIWAWEERETTTTAKDTLARQEISAPAQRSEPTPMPPATAATAPAEAVPTAVPTAKATVPKPHEKAAAANYAAVTQTPARRARRPGTARRAATDTAPGPRAAAATATAAAPETTDLALAKEADAMATTQPASGNAAPAALPDAGRVLAQQLATGAADSASTAPMAAKMNRVAKAKILSLAAPAFDSAAGARGPAVPMPAAPAIRPAPVGGSPALRDYLRREAAAFEPESPAQRLTGTVRIKFVVGADGKLSDLKVTRGLRADYDAEALRMVCEGPAWQPGIAGGRRAPLPMEITVPF